MILIYVFYVSDGGLNYKSHRPLTKGTNQTTVQKKVINMHVLHIFLVTETDINGQHKNTSLSQILSSSIQCFVRLFVRVLMSIRVIRLKSVSVSVKLLYFKFSFLGNFYPITRSSQTTTITTTNILGNLPTYRTFFVHIFWTKFQFTKISAPHIKP